ncbi:hypothetical protein A2X44_01845 [candidate division CPR3 bacterium GWF2_35_18]|nr:MAG: hypothetical protein A2X44_01845 [candidate division CPR3 bacterium GWF2_35_18]OGB65768.1 MAG: hypothetical protein A2250_02105 [candidate division CPR3 bacterium RIFOXYA2_FULL_35_13]OGB79239.1 MAG: hypothetical protein A2296_01005 [candidate division CPR3 bacterium RIFOXYB2_FULL_35_8]
MSGLGYGLENMVNTEMENSESRNIITVTSLKTQQLKIDKVRLGEFRSLIGVESVEPIINLSGDALFHGISQTLPFYGITPTYMNTLSLSYLKGKGFELGDTKKIILSKAVLQDYGISNPDDLIGRNIMINFVLTKNLTDNIDGVTKTIADNEYTVIGIIDKEESPLAYIPAEDLYNIGITYASQTKVIVSNLNEIDEIRENIELLGFKTSNIQDTFDQVERILGILRILLIILGSITLLVAISSILNTITIVLMEQIKKIGFLRIIGIRQEDVKILFYCQSIILSVGGTLIGLLIGSGFGYLVNLRVAYVASQINTPLFKLYETPYIISIIMIVIAFILGFLIGIIPARRSVSMDPLLALRD